MILTTQNKLLMSVGLTLALLGGCGSGSTNNDDNASDLQNPDTGNENNNTENENNNSTDGLVAGSGMLVETKNGIVLAWVNSTGDEFCKISRSTNRTGTVYQDAVGHCQTLASQNYASINSWRLPTVNESKNLMKLENKSLLLFPNSNPDCAIMTTSVENTFVYTTSDWNTRDNNPIGGEFVDASRNNRTAGIRCVATQ